MKALQKNRNGSGSITFRKFAADRADRFRSEASLKELQDNLREEEQLVVELQEKLEIEKTQIASLQSEMKQKEDELQKQIALSSDQVAAPVFNVFPVFCSRSNPSCGLFTLSCHFYLLTSVCLCCHC